MRAAGTALLSFEPCIIRFLTVDIVIDIGARQANAAGASEDSIRRHGRWATDRMTSAYLSPLSLEPVRLLAGFKKERGSYYLERQVLSPPEELCTQVFPEVDHYWEQFTSGHLAEDIAAIGF